MAWWWPFSLQDSWTHPPLDTHFTSGLWRGDFGVSATRLALGLSGFHSPGGSEWIISVGDYVDNSFTALGGSDPREVRLKL